MLPKVAVVCALLAFFSAGSQGNKEASNIYNHLLAARKERFLRFVNQPADFRRDSGSRSDNESGACLPQSPEYTRRLTLLRCDSEYIRAVLSDIETSNCSFTAFNNSASFSRCGINHNGDVCTDIDDERHISPCERDLSCIYHPGIDCGCRNECQTALRQLSDSVGCCIHALNIPIPPSLWSNCNIQQPEVCDNIPKIADILAKRNVGPCTLQCTERQSFYVSCKHLGDRYEQLNRECGYEDVISECAYDKGHFCLDTFVLTLTT